MLLGQTHVLWLLLLLLFLLFCLCLVVTSARILLFLGTSLFFVLGILVFRLFLGVGPGSVSSHPMYHVSYTIPYPNPSKSSFPLVPLDMVHA